MSFQTVRAIALSLLFFSTSVPANEGLEVSNAWSRPLPPVSANGAAYMQITNHGSEAVTLSGGSSVRASEIELHEHVHEDGLMKMQEVEEGIQIAPGETVSFEPGGLHVMLIGLTEPLVEGGQYPMTLQFQDAASVDIQVMVTEQAPDGMSMDSEHKKSHSH